MPTKRLVSAATVAAPRVTSAPVVLSSATKGPPLKATVALETFARLALPETRSA